MAEEHRPAMLTPSRSYSYRTDAVLGARGGEGEVFRGACEVTGKLVAVKLFNHQFYARSMELTPDVRIHKELDAAGQLEAARDLMVLPLAWERDSRQHVLVLPLMNHGDLLDDTMRRHAAGKLMNEDDARHLAGRLLRAMAVVHDLEWGHMDIKLENVLLHDGDAFIADFGHAKPAHTPFVLRTPQAWPNPCIVNFKAPEMFRQFQVCPKACDIWAIGACVLAVLSGTGVDVRSEASLERSLAASSLSAMCRSFLSQSMEFNPGHRATVHQLLTHPWLTGHAAASAASSTSSFSVCATGGWAAAAGPVAGSSSSSSAYPGAGAAVAAASAHACDAASAARDASGGTASTEHSDLD